MSVNCESAAADLPVEMWVKILRYLDPISLLEAVRANPTWQLISQWDHQLKETLCKAEREEQDWLFIKKSFRVQRTIDLRTRKVIVMNERSLNKYLKLFLLRRCEFSEAELKSLHFRASPVLYRRDDITGRYKVHVRDMNLVTKTR